jgi:hypothetical protein
MAKYEPIVVFKDGATSSQLMLLHSRRSTGVAITEEVARAAINGFPLMSMHQREMARGEKAWGTDDCDIYFTWQEQQQLTGQGIFADTAYFKVRVSAVRPHANGLLALPDADRKCISQWFAPYKPSIIVHGQERTTTLNCMPVLDVEVKTQNIPVRDVWDAIKRLNSQAGPSGFTELASGACMELVNIDFTQNLLGTVKPTLPEERYPIFDGTYVAKDNAHYVGFSCITWTPARGSMQDEYARYTVRDLDGSIKVVRLKIDGVEIKVYAKFLYHLITVGAQTTTGNNMQSLAWSTHNNINGSMRNPNFHKYGHSREELRFPKASLPDTLEGVEKFMEITYDQLLNRQLLYQESFLETLDWVFGPNNSLQVGIMQKRIGQQGRYNVAICRNFNSYTYRAQTEFLLDCSKEEGIHFLYATKLALVPMYAYFEKPDWYGKYAMLKIGDTPTLPNLSYLRPSKYSVNHCRAKWSQTTLEEVGLAGGPFQISDKPAELPKLNPFPSVLEKTEDQPDFTTKSDYTKKKKEWVSQVLKPLKAERLAELKKAPDARSRLKARAFSTAPESARVVGYRLSKFGNWEIIVEKGEGGFNCFYANTKTAEQCKDLFSRGIHPTAAGYPIWFYRGERTGTYNGNPVFKNARIVLGDSAEACANNPDMQKFEVIFWEEDHYDRCRGLLIN